jgi:hypothetical protein
MVRVCTKILSEIYNIFTYIIRKQIYSQTSWKAGKGSLTLQQCYSNGEKLLHVAYQWLKESKHMITDRFSVVPFHFCLQMQCGNLPQCQTDSLSSLSTTQTVLLHINRHTIANTTYIYTSCRTRVWSANITSASRSALISESSMPIG